MEIKEMRELPLAELRSEAGKLEATIWKMRFQAKGEPLENSGGYREMKRDRARLLTILREKELGTEETAPAAAAPACSASHRCPGCRLEGYSSGLVQG